MFDVKSGPTIMFLLPRYVAEVSASAVAVEQLDRQGRLNLQPAVAQAAEEWTHQQQQEEEEEQEGEAEVVMVGDNQDQEEESDSRAGGDSPVGVITSSSCDDRNVSSQTVRENFENKVESSCDTVTNSEEEIPPVKLAVEDPRPEQDSLEEVEGEGELSSLDIEDMRENLVLASEEAQQLLSDLNNR